MVTFGFPARCSFTAVALLLLATAFALRAAEPIELQLLGWGDAAHPPVESTTPLTSGLPLGEGVFARGMPTTIVDHSGRSIPHQSLPLAFWPDGSVKWVRLTLLIEPTDVLPYRLIIGEAPDTSDWPSLTVDGEGRGAAVNTGAMSFTLATDGIVSDVRMADGRQAAKRIHATIVRAQREPRQTVAGWLSTAAESGLIAGTKTNFRMGLDPEPVVVIEEAGPILFIARIRGHHFAADGTRFSPYDVRLYAYAGMERLHLQYGFVFDGDPQRDVIAGLRLDVDGPFDGSVDVGLQGGDVHALAGGLKAIQMQPGVVVLDGQIEVKDNLAGWASAAGEVAMTAIVREMWQQYPKAWSAQPGRISIELWPEDDRTVLDLGRTSDGSGTGEAGGDLTANAVGVSKSHEVIFDFGPSAGHAARTAEVIDSGTIFYPSPEYMTGTGALGPLPPLREDIFPKMEKSLRQTVYSLAMQREAEAWYGFIDYGDVRTNREADGWRTQGRYGWRNGSADIHGLFLVQFFRSGDPLAWEFGAPYARHVMDVDTVHYAGEGSSQLVGSMHRRGQDHWSGSTESQYTYSQGIALYHYLSGDLRARDIWIEKIGPYSADPRQATSANAANTCIRIWEATGDPQWRDAARRQMARHLAPGAYDNFRAYLDFLPALGQYWWLTGDEEAKEAFVRQLVARMGPSNWSDDIGYGSGGPYFMARAILYWMTGDASLAVKFPARAFKDRVPSTIIPEEEWTPETVRAGTSTAPGWRVGMLPYFMAALIDLGIGEKELAELPPHRGSSAPNTFHLSPTHPAGFRATGEFKPLTISASLRSDPLDAPFAGEAEDRTGRTMNFFGLPFGADLQVNGVPFRLVHPAADPDGHVLPMLNGSSEVEVNLMAGLSHLHLLGLQVANGFWSEGEPVFELEFLDAEGGVLDTRTLTYLTDIDDYRGWHFASTAHFGRFWSVRGQPTYMIQVLTIDLDGLSEARTLRIREAGNDYLGFLLAASGSGYPDSADEPIAQFGFGDAEPTPSRPVLAATILAEDNEGIGWVPPRDGTKLINQANAVASRGAGWLKVAVPNGDYVVELALSNSFRMGGGIVDICTGSHHVAAFALSHGTDRLWLPARVKDGELDLRIVPVPELETARQTTEWSLSEVKIHRVDALPHPLIGKLEIIEFPGINVARGATASKSVGNTIRYHNRGVANAIDGDPLTFYSLLPAYPEDVIVEFSRPHTLNGVVLTFSPNQLATQLRAQVPDGAGWRDVATYDNSQMDSTVGIDLNGVKAQRLRILIEEGTPRNLTIRNLVVFGD